MYVAAVFLPLVGSFLAGVIAFLAWGAEEDRRKRLDRGAQLITVGAMLLAAVAATFAFVDIVVNKNVGTTELFTWVDSGTMEFAWALRGGWSGCART